jgi:hypothetical protein
MFLNRFGDHRCLHRRPRTPQPDRRNAGGGLPPPEDEFADSTLHPDYFIHDPRAKAFDNPAVDALIGRKRQRGSVSSG